MKLTTKIILALRYIGLRQSINAILYAFNRDRLERQHERPRIATSPQRSGELLSFEEVQGGACLIFANAELEVVFVTADLVRLTWTPGTLPVPYSLDQREWRLVDTNVKKTGKGYSVSSSQLEILVAEDGGVKYLDMEGSLLRNERPPERQGETWIHQVDLRTEETIYGLGERAARLNLRGSSYRMWNRDPGGMYGSGTDPLYFTIPVYISNHLQGCTLVFYENSFDGQITLGNPATAVFEGGALRYYVAVGSPSQVIELYTQLTGRPPLPPRWALEYHQSRWGYKTENDIREVMAGFQEHGLPLSALHLDIDYMNGYRVFTVDGERFPDLRRLATDLLNQGIVLVASLNPAVKRDSEYEIYVDGLTEGMFCMLPEGIPLTGLSWPGWCAFPDFTKPETRAWWGNYYARLVEAGVSGYWHDMNEPTSFSAWGDSTFPLPTRHKLECSAGDHRYAHNLYGLLMNRAGYEALRRQQPDRRPWILSRSGWAGQQRYAWNWTGDIESTWNALRITIPTVLNLGLSGIPYSGPDIGGFSGHPSSELYVRWFQLATFLPFYRTHSAMGITRREPWVFGEPTLTIVREFMLLRLRLIPYLYTLAWEASQTGHPLVRALFWPEAEEPDLWDVDDTFMLGQMLLVAPILEKDALSRDVRLPKGDWYNFWDDTLIEGPALIEKEAVLERIPVFVAAGSVLPMEEAGILELHLYPSGNGMGYGQLYSDAGDGYGSFRVDEFNLSRKGGELKLSREYRGDYQFPYQSIEIYLHGVKCERAWVDGVEIQFSENRIQVDTFKQVRLQVT
jgi:alpha-glucosidase